MTAAEVLVWALCGGILVGGIDRLFGILGRRL